MTSSRGPRPPRPPRPPESPFAPLLDATWPAGMPDVDDLPRRAAPIEVDDALLARALREAWKGVGRTYPNPPVGAVVARGRRIVGVGHHTRAGTPHAEVHALDAAGKSAKGATLYVTLEPCVHFGRTPPCVDRVLKEGIARVVVGTADPDPRVDGKGVKALRRAGVAVEVRRRDPLGRAALALVEPFTTRVQAGRPFVVVKVAASLDGKVATSTGHSRFVTGEAARHLVHGLRDRCDAVLVGAGTVMADAPALTVRTGRKGARDPLRVVIDGELRTDPTSAVFGPGSLVIHHGHPPSSRVRAFERAGVLRLGVGERAGHVDVEAALRALAARGVTSVLVEPGPALLGALLGPGLVDELWWFTADVIVGADGRSAVPALGTATMDRARRFPAGGRRIDVGADTLVVGRLR